MFCSCIVLCFVVALCAVALSAAQQTFTDQRSQLWPQQPMAATNSSRQPPEPDPQMAFGMEWVKAWNSRDIEAILSHYADEIEVGGVCAFTLGRSKCTPWILLTNPLASALSVTRVGASNTTTKRSSPAPGACHCQVAVFWQATPRTCEEA